MTEHEAGAHPGADPGAQPGAQPIPAEARFEDLQRELDTIVSTLEQGDVPVDEAIRLWQRGEELYRACAERLAQAELKVEELLRSPDEQR